MNFLAHVFLARQDDEAMLGALLGDFVGSADLHRKIDSYTDRHPEVVAARASR